MVAYQDFVALSESGDSEERGMAAHLAAMAYLGHHGPAEEQAALYAALIGFLDDLVGKGSRRAGLRPASRRTKRRGRFSCLCFRIARSSRAPSHSTRPHCSTPT